MENMMSVKSDSQEEEVFSKKRVLCKKVPRLPGNIAKLRIKGEYAYSNL